ncbi:PilW family protein [Roseateles sp. LYH14W]|uniref:PilW family protein n=1 Tax=Pelomonas parva TaxID=3299032 RepID=A0ABW7F467_9BURK
MTSFQQRGLGLVELMVGITVGLIVAAGASMVAVNQINEHRRLMLETQIQQDLRAAADLIQQDLRRAGFRGLPGQGVWSPPMAVGTQAEKSAGVVTANKFVEMVKTERNDDVSLTYLYARDGSTGEPVDADHFGIRWNKGKETLYVQIGSPGGAGNWQPITDPESIRITGFNIDIESKPVDLPDFCDKPCTPAAAGGVTACPTFEVRRVKFTITAEAKHDAKVKRTLSNVGRMRADVIKGACPA